MAKRKNKKARIVRFAMLAFVIYVGVSLTFMQIDIKKRKESIAVMEAELKEQQYINQEIKNILDSGENSEYVMRIAREKLGLVFPDEKVYIDYNRKK